MCCECHDWRSVKSVEKGFVLLSFFLSFVFWINCFRFEFWTFGFIHLWNYVRIGDFGASFNLVFDDLENLFLKFNVHIYFLLFLISFTSYKSCSFALIAFNLSSSNSWVYRFIWFCHLWQFFHHTNHILFCKNIRMWALFFS